MIILFKTIEKNSIAICFVSRWRPHTLFSSVVFPESCKPTSPETNVLTNLFDQAIGVVGVPIKHSLTRMHRILWTASMHAILRRMLSLLSSVLFSIPLPWKFSIPRSLEIALQSGLNLVETLLVKHEKQGFFCAVDAVVVSQIRDLLHSTRVYLSDKLLGLENKRQKTSFIWWLNTLKSSAVIQRRTWTMFCVNLYQQSISQSHVWEILKRNCGQGNLAVVPLGKCLREVFIGHIPCHSTSDCSCRQKDQTGA